MGMVKRGRPAIQLATLSTNSGWHFPADPSRSHAWLMPDLPGKGSAADACHQIAWSRLTMWQVVVGITPPSPSLPAFEPQILRQQHTPFDFARRHRILSPLVYLLFTSTTRPMFGPATAS